MGKKLLLFKVVIFWLFALGTIEAYGQCPTSVGVSANPGTTICTGQEITFTANPGGGSGYQYQWQINQVDVSGETASTFTSTSLTNGQQVRVVVTSNAEGNNGCSTSSSEVPVTVNPVRTVKVAIAVNNSYICPGETVNFSISSQSNVISGSLYEWRVNNISLGNFKTFSSSSLVAGDRIQLWVDSAVPCTEPVLSNLIEITEKAGAPVTPGAINGETTVCPGTSNLVYSISSVADATSYEWALPPGWSGTSVTNSLKVTSGSTGNATIKVRARNECGDSEFQNLNVNVQDATPAQPGTISGPSPICPGVSADYSIAPVSRATEYIWTLPDGSFQTTTAPNIKVTTSSSGNNSNISVQAKNTCGTSAKRDLNITIKPGKPAAPAAITGNSAVCPGISQTYSVAAVTGATSYIWALPAGWTGTSTSRSITVTTGTTGGNIAVIAKNDCDESATQELNVTVNPGTPTAPEFNSPPSDVCPGAAETFSINEVPGATGYIWTLPTGWTGTSTTNTISITSASAGTGSISVRATNGCGISAKETITVAIKPPAPTMTAAIQGPDNVCASTPDITFTVPEVQYASEYIWSAPGWTITNGQGSRSITVTSGTGAGTISVKAKNNCGESIAATKAVSVTSGVPAQPGGITSSLGNNQNICPPLSGITFSVPVVTGATGYNWKLPAGWEITSGANTRSIMVKVTQNAPYQNENVSVRATNICGESESRNFTDITVSNFIITDLGDDQLVCRAKDPIPIDIELYFGGSNRLKPTWSTSGDGSFPDLPKIGGGNSANNLNRFFTIHYIPGNSDITKEYITVTMIVPKPNGSNPCGSGVDEMRIYFRDDPTAIISTSTAICTGTATTLNITGTPNSEVTYSKGTQTGLKVNVGPSGTAIIPTGVLTTNTTFELTGISNTDAPTCFNTLTSSATVTVTQKPTATINYMGPYCSGKTIPTGAADLDGEYAFQGGIYSATGDLAAHINAENGSFIPGEVDPGSYTVSYTTPASGGCEIVTATTEVTITPLPTATIAYESSPFCSLDTADKLVTLTGTNAYTGGTYSSTEGLDINSFTGVIKAANSEPGIYTVTYTIPAASGCDVVTATTEVTITEIPGPIISYPQEAICKEDANTYTPGISGTGEVFGGSFSAPSGLEITSAGIITPSASTPGTYKIIYTLAPANGCDEATAETEVTINAVPSVDISYAGPFCESTTGSKQVIMANETGVFEGGSFTATPSGLKIDASTGAIIPSSSETGDYSVTYTIPSNGGCSTKLTETTVKITAVPDVNFTYPEAPFCSTDASSYSITYSNPEGNYENGVFSGTAGLDIDVTTGAITPNSSTPGNHKIIYTIPTGEGCEAVTTAVDIVIIKPVEITSQPYNVGKCTGETAKLEVVAEGIDLTYQWFKNGTEIPGATLPILQFSPVTPNDAAQYYVEISGSAPCSGITSESASLIVDQNILVDSTPEDKELCVGDSTSFTVEASANGGIVEYQWMRNGGEIEGATSKTLFLDDISLEDKGEYSVFLKGPEGYTCSTITYTAGDLEVFEKPVPVAGNNITICYSEGAIDITDGASVSNASSILWESNGTGTISNADKLNEATYTPGADEAGILTLTLTAFGNSTCAEVKVQKTIEIERLPVISSFSYSATEFCETDPELKEPSIAGVNAFQNGSFTVIPSSGLSINADGKINPSESNPDTYEITYSTPAGTHCGPVISQVFTVVIGLEPIAEFFYDSSTYCRDTRDTSQNVNPVLTLSEARGENFDFFNVVDESGAIIANSELDFNADTGAIHLSNSNAGDYVVQRTLNYTGDEEDGCIAVIFKYPITIIDKPIADFSYSTVEFCSNDSNPLAQFSDPAVAGIFSEKNAAAGLIFANTSTGEINLAASSPGNYTVVNTVDINGDSCSPVTAEFSISITKLLNASFSYPQTAYCQDTATDPSPNFLGDTGGTFSGSNGLVVDPNTGVIDLLTSTANDPNDINDFHTVIYTIGSAGGCIPQPVSFNLRIDGKPLGGELEFAGLNRATYLVCHDATSGSSRAIQLSGHYGKVLKWQKTDDPADPNSWIDIANTETSYSDYSGLTKTTLFRAVLENGSCGLAYSKFAVISVIPANIKPDPVEASLREICIGTEIQLTSEVNYSSNTEIAQGGTFNNANPKGWIVDGNPDNNFPANGNNTKPNRWSETNNHPFDTRDGSKTFDSGDKKFAIVSGRNSSTMETPAFSTFGLSTATLQFDEAFIMGPNTEMKIELSLDGGNSYTVVLRDKPYGLSGDNVYRTNNYTNFSGSNISIDLSEYVGQPDLKIRFTFDGNNTDGSIWAIDNIAIPNRPLNVASIWSYTNAQEEKITIENQQNISVKPDKIGLNTFKITSYLITDDGSECKSEDPNNSATVDVYVFDKYTSTASSDLGTCGQNEFSLHGELEAQEQGTAFNFPTEDGFSAPFWKVEGPAGYSFKNPTIGDTGDPQKNPNAVFVAPNVGTYILTWSIERNVNDGRNASSCPPVTIPTTVVIKDCIALDFDGIDDFVDLGENYTGDYSIEAWIRPEAATGTIISGPNFKVTTPPGVVANSRWYHIAISGGILYIDGIDKGPVSQGTGGHRSLIGAEWVDGKATNFFSGWIEEVRLWKKELTVEQIHFMMNQRLIPNGTQMGEQIPIDVPGGLRYSDLAGYYRLISADPDPQKLISFNIALQPQNGETPNLANPTFPGRLVNMETDQENTAPLPYFSASDGFWETDATWARPEVWDPPHTGQIEWNIVKTSNFIKSGEKDIKVLGLIVESNELEIAAATNVTPDWKNTGQKLEVTHYLRLDGSIDLVGESQLLQPLGSFLEEASMGFLERNQQGTQSSFNYNYWSSPVSERGAANNANYSIGSVLVNPAGTLTFSSSPFAADGTPKNSDNIVISNYWLWTFKPGVAGEYAEWDYLGSTGMLKTGEGFTMKGTSGAAAISDRQNYTFKGKPHNGNIYGQPVGPDQNYLIGNPYPSAIDSWEFMLDNLNGVTAPGGTPSRGANNTFNGSLYFWDHFAGATHYLEEYIGGYATLNFSGGIEAVSIDERINANNDKSSKRPGRYIPVGQGFFINTASFIEGGSPVSGGTIVFQNNQRIYERETDPARSLFMSQERKDRELSINHTKQQEDSRQKIWIKYRSPKGYHRQLLVTADAGATDGFDLGFDAPLIEDNVEDIYWYFSNYEFVIQAVQDFNPERELDLGLKIQNAGTFKISIEELMNIPDNMNIYIRDSLINVTHDLRKEAYTANSEAGTFTNRLKIVFQDNIHAEPEPEPEVGDFKIMYVNGTREIFIANPKSIEIEKVYLNNMLGQQVHMFYNISNGPLVKLPVKRFGSGVYVIKVYSDNGITTKKVILE